MRPIFLTLALVLGLNAALIGNAWSSALMSGWQGTACASGDKETVPQAPTSERHIMLSDVNVALEAGFEADDEIGDSDDFLGELYGTEFRFSAPSHFDSFAFLGKPLRSPPLPGEIEPPRLSFLLV